MSQVTFQQYAWRNVRAAAILTNAYVAGTVLGVPTNDNVPQQDGRVVADPVEDLNFLAIEYDFTKGSLTDAQVQIEFSDDNSTFYVVQKGTVSAGVDTMTPFVIKVSADSKGYVNVNAECFSGAPFKTRYIRISAIGTGTVTSSSLALKAVIGVA